MRITFADLGAMGHGRAGRLIAAGRELAGDDPAPDAGGWLAERGAAVAGSLDGSGCIARRRP